MPRVSKRTLHQKDLVKLDQLLSSLIKSLQTETDVNYFLEAFLTQEEKIMLSKRLMIFLLLKMGLDAKNISEVAHVSYETVRVHRSNFYTKNKVFHLKIEQLMKKEAFKEFMQKIETILKPISLMLETKSNMRSRAKLYNGDFK